MWLGLYMVQEVATAHGGRFPSRVSRDRAKVDAHATTGPDGTQTPGSAYAAPSRGPGSHGSFNRGQGGVVGQHQEPVSRLEHGAAARHQKIAAAADQHNERTLR